LNDIDLTDISFRFPSIAGDDGLADSIGRLGLVDPPILAGEGSRYRVLTGWRRIRAVERLGWESLETWVVVGEPGEPELLNYAAALRLLEGPLGPVDIAWLLDRFLSVHRFDDRRLRQEVLPGLGIRLDPTRYEQHKLLNRLSDELRRAVAEGLIPVEIGAELAGLSSSEGSAIVELYRNRPFSSQDRIKIYRMLRETGARDSITAADLINSVIRELDDSGDKRRFAALFLARLKQLRYPRLARAERLFRSLVMELDWPGRVHWLPPPSFEGGDHRVEIRFGDGAELARSARKVAEVAADGRVDELYRSVLESTGESDSPESPPRTGGTEPGVATGGVVDWRKQIRLILVDKVAAAYPLTETILRFFPDVPRVEVDGPRRAAETVPESADPVRTAKEVLYLTTRSGPFLQACPGTKGYLCCGYTVLNLVHGCGFECAYCILQEYFHDPFTRIFVNREDMFAELERFFSDYPDRLMRVGTGEFTDSLYLEPALGYAESLVSFFSRRPNALLELKTKSDDVDHLLDLDHGGRTVLAWSLAPEGVIKSVEPGNPGLNARLEAAGRAGQAGYRLAFHFDPMIHYPGWRDGYAELAVRLFDTVDPDRVAWISLGALRFRPGLLPVIRRRFPESRLETGEFVIDRSGKYRYYKGLRVEMFRHLADRLRAAGGEKPLLYLCMEDREVWDLSLGAGPDSTAEIATRLDRRVRSG
jgi:spore photoproduct lyase